MRFLCVECDAQMKLRETISHEDIGSLSVVFACPECNRQTAMMTNPGETQLVSSLGIKVQAGEDGEEQAPRCPFSAGLHANGGSERPEEPKPIQAAVGGVAWTAEAISRLDRVPDLVRPMAKMGIEKFAAERGLQEINEEVLEEARAVFGL